MTDANIPDTELASIFDDLALVESSLRSSLKVYGYLENSRVDFKEKTKTLKAVFKNYISPKAYEFIFFLLRSNTINLLTEILRNYQRTRKDTGIVEFEIKTAIPLTQEERNPRPERCTATRNRHLTVRNIVDPDIIGGMVVKAGDIMIDASVDAKLKVLNKKLRQS
jgi:F-type H+-transporting ATPase subunit delta